jgi:hypothetical protein
MPCARVPEMHLGSRRRGARRTQVGPQGAGKSTAAARIQAMSGGRWEVVNQDERGDRAACEVATAAALRAGKHVLIDRYATTRLLVALLSRRTHCHSLLQPCGLHHAAAVDRRSAYDVLGESPVAVTREGSGFSVEALLTHAQHSTAPPIRSHTHCTLLSHCPTSASAPCSKHPPSARQLRRGRTQVQLQPSAAAHVGGRGETNLRRTCGGTRAVLLGARAGVYPPHQLPPPAPHRQLKPPGLRCHRTPVRAPLCTLPCP